MRIAQLTAGSGIVLGGVVVLLAQQLGLLPLSQLWPTVYALGLGVFVGGLVFGAVGWAVDRR
ncbi:MAG TPA: hypothetical protein VEH10_05230 [Thermoplasmata archaeon]|nr:hypothetical protein [Thermoplasmata archaeon]